MLHKARLLLTLSLSIFFVTGCTPPEPKVSILGSWSADSMTGDGSTVTDVVYTFIEGGTFTDFVKMSGEQKMLAGTFTPATFPADTPTTFTVDTWIGTGAPSLPVKFYLMYSNLTDTTVDMKGDADPPDGFDDAACTFAKETPPDPDKIFGMWACAQMIPDAMTMDAVFLTMNADATYYISYFTTDTVTQTGTFAPAAAPADTPITFHVDSSTGPGAPPVDTEYFLRYSNLTDHAVDIELDPMADGWDGPFDFIR